MSSTSRPGSLNPSMSNPSIFTASIGWMKRTSKACRRDKIKGSWVPEWLWSRDHPLTCTSMSSEKQTLFWGKSLEFGDCFFQQLSHPDMPGWIICDGHYLWLGPRLSAAIPNRLNSVGEIVQPCWKMPQQGSQCCHGILLCSGHELFSFLSWLNLKFHLSP